MSSRAQHARTFLPNKAKGPRFPGPFALFLLIFFDLDDFATLVIPALRADGVRETHLTAVAALDELGHNEGVVGAPAVAASLRKFAFWLWNHFYSSFPVR
jgi:hypothetical protein